MSAATSTPATDRDGTSFMASVLAEHVPLGVELVSDLVLKPHFAAADLEREKDVVLQELGEARDTPSDIIFDDLWSAAFADQPLGRSVLGDEASIDAITVDDLHDWRRGLYRAGSLALVAAGKIEHDRLVELAEARLGGPSRRHDRPAGAGAFTGGTRVGRAGAGPGASRSRLPGAGAARPDYFAARLFSDVVGGGMSSRLFQQVREDRGLAYSVYSQLHPYADSGLFYVYAATARRESAAAAQLIEEIVAEAARRRVTQREVDRVRTQSRAALLMSMESPWGQAHYVARQLVVHGRLVEPAEVVAELEAVTLDQVREAGAQDARRARARGRRSASRPSARREARHPRRRALGRLRAGRQRPRPQARALRPLPLHPARAAGDVGAGARRSGTPTASSSPAPTRKAAGAGTSPRPVPREGWELGWEEVRFRAQAPRSATSPSSPTWRRNGRGCASGSGEGSEALNLFGYTGVGTLAMAATGARLTHVDASKKSVEAGKENALLSGMADRPIRWLVDDAAKFAAREVRRGRRYDGIILDPPKYRPRPGAARSGGWRRACRG